MRLIWLWIGAFLVAPGLLNASEIDEVDEDVDEAIIADEVSEAAAESPSERPSFLGLELTVGDDSYKSTAADLIFGLGSAWQLRTGATFERSSAENSAWKFRLGANVNVSESVSLDAELGTRLEPDRVRVHSISPGINWELSSLWAGALETHLFFDLDGEWYVQNGSNGKGRTRSLLQGGVSAGVTQDLPGNLSAAVSFSRSGYNDASLLQQILKRWKRRLRDAQGLQSESPGSSVTLNLDWQALDSLGLGVSASSFKAEDDETARLTSF